MKNFLNEQPLYCLNFEGSGLVVPHIPFSRATALKTLNEKGKPHTFTTDQPRLSRNLISGDVTGLAIARQQTDMFVNSPSTSTGNNYPTQWYSTTVSAGFHYVEFVGKGVEDDYEYVDIKFITKAHPDERIDMSMQTFLVANGEQLGYGLSLPIRLLSCSDPNFPDTVIDAAIWAESISVIRSQRSVRSTIGKTLGQCVHVCAVREIAGATRESKNAAFNIQLARDGVIREYVFRVGRATLVYSATIPVPVLSGIAQTTKPSEKFTIVNQGQLPRTGTYFFDFTVRDMSGDFFASKHVGVSESVHRIIATYVNASRNISVRIDGVANHVFDLYNPTSYAYKDEKECRLKIAYSLSDQLCIVAVNGVTVQAVPNRVLPEFERLAIGGHASSDGYNSSFDLHCFKTFTTAATVEQLITMTT